MIADCAFPSEGVFGLTKREWFAGMALAGCGGMTTPKEAAEWCVKAADRLIEELKEPQKEETA